MHAPQARSNSLTAHLARAAGGDAHAQEGDEVTVPPAAVNGRCTVSLAPGQHCGRPALDGQRICAGHAAMGEK